MDLLVLAGGFGTRLKTTVNDVPKALAPVCGVPFLQIQLENWVQQGLREFSFLLHHQADQIIDFVSSLTSEPFQECQFRWCIEEEPLGTGGAISHAVKELALDGDFLVINADTWLNNGAQDMMQASCPAIGVVHQQNTERYGQVIFDHQKKILSFSEKKDKGSSGWINSGLYRLSAELFKNWDGSSFSLEEEFSTWVVEQKKLNAVLLETAFIDIGAPVDYKRFCNWVESGRTDLL